MANINIRNINYALPEIALSGMILFIYVYYPNFMLSNHGVSPMVVGISLLLIKSFDFLISPLIGGWINNYKINGGRFYSILKITAPFVAISALLILLLPGKGLISTNLACLIYSFLFIIFWSIYNIAYQSVGLSIKCNSAEALDLFSWRDAASLAGTILISGILALAASLSFSEQSRSYLAIAIMAVILLIAGYKFMLSYPEVRITTVNNHKSSPLKSALKDPLFRSLALYFFLTGFGSALSGSLIIIYLKSVLAVTNPEMYVFLFFILSFLSIPLWNFFAKRSDKNSALIAAMLLSAISFAGVIFLKQGQENIYALLISLSALGIGGCLIIPSAMQAQICQSSFEADGVPKEAAFAGMWSMIKKISAALATGIGFTYLDYSGFSVNESKTADTLNSIILLYAGIPFACYLAAIFFLLKFPIYLKYFNKEKLC